MKKVNYLLAKQIMAAVLSGGMMLLPNWGYALPQGGQIVGGNGNISTPDSGKLNISGSGNLAIDWNSFSIAQGEAVNFQKMSEVLNVLNYVTGSSRSEIFGKITGNGVNVFLINPNGILFGATAEVNVGSLYASTRSLDAAARSGFGGSMTVLGTDSIAKVEKDIINLGTVVADSITFEGNNISIVSADKLQIKDRDYGKIALKAKNDINIGYEVTKITVNDLGDNTSHEVGDYYSGNGTKAGTLGIQATDLAGNAKSVQDYMLVHDVYELQAMKNNLNGKYMLAKEIDASVTKDWNSDLGFKPLNGFKGNVDGVGNSIKNLNINRKTTENVALFGWVQDATLKNFGLFNADVSGGKWTAGIAGELYGNTVIENVWNKNGKVTGDGDYVGGIVGECKQTSSVKNALNSSTVTNKGTASGKGSYTGGIAGYNSGVLDDVSNTGNVTGNYYYTGGVVGRNEGTVKNSLNKGFVNSNSYYTGGIAGMNRNVISNVVNSGNVKSLKGYIGGIIGYNWASAADASVTVSNASNKGTVEGSGNYVGGIIGYNHAQGNKSIITLENLVNTGNITNISTSGGYVGGIVGYNYAQGNGSEMSITNSSNSGAVTGNGEYIGGIIGQINAKQSGTLVKVSNSENTGKVYGKNGYVGGIAGAAEGYSLTDTPNINITNIKNEGEITSSNNDVGGCLGSFNEVYIENSENVGDVKGLNSVGGIAGSMGIGTITKSVNSGTVTSTYTGASSDYGSGGIVGSILLSGSGLIKAINKANISETYNKGAVNGRKNTGGIVGYTNILDNPVSGNKGQAFLKEVFNTGDINYGTIVDSSYENIGGIIGRLWGECSINDAYNLGNVSGGESVGGICGCYNAFTEIKNIYNMGNINGTESVGGIIGAYYGLSTNTERKVAIDGAYNGGQVSGTTEIGGIIGYMEINGVQSVVNNTYNDGMIAATGDNAGGIIGYAYMFGTPVNQIKKSHNAGNVSAAGDNAGGIIGYNHMYSKYHPTYSEIKVELDTVSNVGIVSGNSNIGGLVGKSDFELEYTSMTGRNGTLDIKNAEYATDIKGGAQAFGSVDSHVSGLDTQVTGKVIANIAAKDKFSGWDIGAAGSGSTWRTYNGTTPILNAFISNLFGKENAITSGNYNDIQWGTAANPFLVQAAQDIVLDWNKLGFTDQNYLDVGVNLTINNFHGQNTDNNNWLGSIDTNNKKLTLNNNGAVNLYADIAASGLAVNAGTHKITLAEKVLQSLLADKTSVGTTLDVSSKTDIKAGSVHIDGTPEEKNALKITVNGGDEIFRTTDYSKGTGNSYQISLNDDTVTEKAWMHINDVYELQAAGDGSMGKLDGYYWLTGDIDADATKSWDNGFSALGNSTTAFTGIFAGNDHVISGLQVSSGTDAGLFGVIGAGGSVSDLGLNGSSIRGVNAGGVAGTNNGTIENVYSIGGSINGTSAAGGLAGSNTGTIKNAYSTDSVTGSGTGSAIGTNSGSVKNVYGLGAAVVIGTNNGGSVENTYGAVWNGTALAGYQAFGETGKLLDLAGFGAAFEDGLTAADGQVWRVYEGQNTPLLRSFLKQLTIDGNTVTASSEVIYNGTQQTLDLGPLQNGVLTGGKTEAGEYKLSDLLYSGQNGYDITVVNDKNVLTIKKDTPVDPPVDPPVPPIEPPAPPIDMEAADVYHTALVHVKGTDKQIHEEQRNIQKTTAPEKEQIKVQIKGRGIKIEEEEMEEAEEYF